MRNKVERFIEFFHDISVYLLSALIAGISWLVRKVFTNEKEIGIIKSNLENMYNTMDEHQKDSIRARQELKQSLDNLSTTTKATTDKLTEANIELIKYLRDNNNKGSNG